MWESIITVAGSNANTTLLEGIWLFPVGTPDGGDDGKGLVAINKLLKLKSLAALRAFALISANAADPTQNCASTSVWYAPPWPVLPGSACRSVNMRGR